MIAEAKPMSYNPMDANWGGAEYTQSLIDAMAASKQNFVRTIELFDEFRPKAGSSSMADDEKSLAFRVTLLNTQETLQDAQIEAVMTALLASLEKNCAARLR